MTENYTGLANAYVLIGKESEEGTGVSATKDIGIVTDINTSWTNEPVPSRGMSSRNLDQLQLGQFRFSVDVTCEFQHGRLLEYAMGAVAHGGASDPYTHTFTSADTLPSMSMEIGLDKTTDDTEKLLGGKVESYTLACDMSGVVTERATIRGMNVLTGTTAGTAVTDDLPTLPWAVSSMTTFGGGVTQLRSWEWTVTNALEPIDKMSAYRPDGHVAGAQDFSGKFTAAFTDTNERSKFLAGQTGQTAPATADFAGGTVAITSDLSASNRSLVMTLTDTHFAEYTRPIAVAGMILQDFTFTHRTASIVSENDIASGSW